MAVRQAKPPRAEKKLNKITKKPKIKSENKVLLVAQEIKFAKTLAGNDKKARDKVLKNLKKWLTYRSASSFEFSEHDFMRLWKGLFYCVWMSDKPLVQEDLCENISALLDCFGNEKIQTSALFYKCFLKTMAADWFGIDQHRIDKFLMLVRRMTRGILRCGQRVEWSPQSLSAISSSVGALLKEVNGLGLQMHLADLWMEEVAKVGGGSMSPEVVGELTRPFAEYLCYGQETRLAGSIMRHIFTHLIRQTDLGIDYTEKLNAWKHAGYPGGSIDAMTKVEYSDEEEEEEPEEPEQEADGEEESDEDNGQPKRKVGLDARAGHVDAVLPQLTVDGELMATMLKNMITDARSTLSNRSKLKGLVQAFETLASGEYPYKMKETTMPDDPKFRLPKAMKSAVDLMVFEEMHEDEEMKGMNKRQRRKYLMKQRKLEEARGADEDEGEEEAPQLLSPSAPKKPKKDDIQSIKADAGVWQVEDVKETEDVRPDSSKNNISIEDDSTVKKGKKSKNERKRLKKESNKASSATEEPKKTTPKKKKEKNADTSASVKESSDASIKETPVKNSATPKKADKTKVTPEKPKKDINGALSEDIGKNSLKGTPKTPKVSKKDINGALSEDIGKNSPKGTPKTPKVSAASTPKKADKLKLNVESVIKGNKLIGEEAKKNTPTNKDYPVVKLTKLDKSIFLTPKKGDTSLENIKAKKSINNLDDTPKAAAVAKSPKSAKKDSPISAKKGEKITTTENGETEILIKKTQTKKLIAKDRLNTSDSGVLKSQKNRLNILKANLSLTSSPTRKKVMIALKNNTSQHVIDYFKSVKQSPEIPFDGLKRPSKTALKPNTLPSPINPFYKKKLKLNF